MPSMTSSTLTRRTLLAASGAASLAVVGGARATAEPSAPGLPRLGELERRHDVTIGLWARNLRTGRELAHRADSRFPICSVFKALAVAALLRGDLVVPDAHVLRRPAHIPPAALLEVSPFVEQCLRDGTVPTVEQLCVATLQLSDNTAGNEVLARIGGPTAVTRFARSLGDTTTRLDRWEPELNSAEPDRVTDTTSPRAVGRTVAGLLTGRSLPRRDRDRLTGWMLGSTTSAERLRAALPPGWQLADKTGGGSYAVNNDVGVAWAPDGTPLALAVMVRSDDPAAVREDTVVAEVGRLCVAELGPGRR
ncbi:class A beta-lactamase [Auraticoccus sp. F435]|uniref:Beta-lactamase n=2 Tax=Auraticoccus cholistanensis TaxID=2656650 RepID=A0A6A9V2L4_9ACTN|nr:class A beta-lactamase [Auraticoccus cholistanensis]